MKTLRSHALSEGGAKLGNALEGWRRTLLSAPLLQFAADFPLKS